MITNLLATFFVVLSTNVVTTDNAEMRYYSLPCPGIGGPVITLLACGEMRKVPGTETEQVQVTTCMRKRYGRIDWYGRQVDVLLDDDILWVEWHTNKLVPAVPANWAPLPGFCSNGPAGVKEFNRTNNAGIIHIKEAK